MKIVAPDYYNEFSCIAGKCQHNCCIGWEIDVDDKSFEYYSTVEGEFGKKLSENIISDGNSRCFKLSEDDRCPFLNEDNLCDIIINIGEDKLCQICSDHPRYRNFFDKRTEIGLGLCCEAAAELILTKKDKTKLTVLSDDGNNEDGDDDFLFFRDKLFSIVQDRTKKISKRIENLNVAIPKKTPREWGKIYLELERLDETWTDRLNKLKDLKSVPEDFFSGDEWETVFEQLLVYFLYRHTADGLYDGRLKERIAFSVHGLQMVCLLCAAEGKTGVEDFLDTARMYSSEIEYCEENMNAILEILQ